MLTEATIQKYLKFFESTPAKDFPMHAVHREKTLVKSLLAEELGKEKCFSSGFKQSTLLSQINSYFKVLELLNQKVGEILDASNPDHWPLLKDFVSDATIVLKSMLKVRLANNKYITAERLRLARRLSKEKDGHRKEKSIRKTLGMSSEEEHDEDEFEDSNSDTKSKKKPKRKRRSRKTDTSPGLTEVDVADKDVDSSTLRATLKSMQQTENLSAEVELVEASTKKVKADTELEEAKRKTIQAQLEMMRYQDEREARIQAVSRAKAEDAAVKVHSA